MSKEEVEGNKSPFLDQSYHLLHSDTQQGEFSFNDSDVNQSNHRVFSDESFKTVRLTNDFEASNSAPVSNQHAAYYPSDQNSINSALPTPNLNTDHAFTKMTSNSPSGRLSPPIMSPGASRKPSLRFKLPTSAVNHNVQSPFNDSNENIIKEDEIYNLPKPNSPFMETFQFSSEESEELGDDKMFHVDEGMKRHRWGTTRNKKGKPRSEKVNRSKTMKGILRPTGVLRSLSRAGSSKEPSRTSSRSNSAIRGPNTNSAIIAAYDTSDSEDESIEEDNQEPVDPRDKKHEKRVVVLNQELPEEYIDPETNKSNVTYPRNKIRTTKYTPLSFLPKNISNQFLHNVANIYFLIMIIIGYFDIFGVPSPELAMVPLIVIVLLTAIKDAIEDSRRTASDLEVNNQPTHILDNINDSDPDFHYENLNVGEEKVSLWRRFKKLNSRLLFKFIGASKRNLTKEGRAKKIREKQQLELQDMSENRKSFDSDIISPRPSMAVDEEDNFRKSFQSRRSLQGRRSMHGSRSKSLKFQKRFWKDLKVGDVVRVYNNEEIPADIIILSTSEEDNGCYVETKNLDGETNLKVKSSLKYGNDHKIKKADDVKTKSFEIESEGPHPNLYSYQGNLKYYDVDDNGEPTDLKEESITINNLLLRGCSLRNTKWVVGIVVFTGNDTKIMINAGVTPTKQSRISRELNYYVIINFILLFIICFVSGLVNGFYYATDNTTRNYYEFGTIAGSPALNGLVSFVVAVILYQSLVPISLYITIEIIKSAQAFFIYSDINMYYEKLDFPCTPKSWSISDDLGQIEYVFSDKTGTLTQNLMEFKKCTINGVSYGRAYTEALAGLRKRQGYDVEQEAAIERDLIAKDRVEMIASLKKLNEGNEYTNELSFVSKSFVDDLNGAKGALQKKSNEHFMLALALCHSVLIEKDEKTGKPLLKAQSPDEAALVGTARSLGFSFIGNTKKGILVEIQGVTKEYQVLNVLEFNSTRKRMSALIKIPPANDNENPKVLLICKGADSIIYGRLSKTQNDSALLQKTSAHLEEYATEGLRTLCIAQREIEWNQYLEWSKRHNAAASSLENREDQMEMVADSIETELILLGGTAIEDRLQDGVPDSISVLGQAGIKLWVLTGDKVETAINIGFSCNLLGNDMELLIIKLDLNDEERTKFGVRSNYNNTQAINALLSNYLSTYFEMEGSFEELEDAKKNHSPPNEKFGVVIDGDALKTVLNDKDCKRKFLLLCKQCKAVLCCRVSPSQKAGVVKLVKDTLDVMTLAIGDGSNDVAMIQAADIGVGIAGEEGRQAVMSSDYAIGQFRYLARLLLTHGRWSYKRFSEMIPAFFYKNVIFSIALFWYGIYNDFDGSYLFEFTYLMFYNLAFTSLPVIFLGVLDQDVSAKVSMLVPELYRSGILRQDFTQTKFWIYMFDGIYQSVVAFFFPYLCYRVAFQDEGGLLLDHRFWIGVTVTSIACISCNLYILLHQYRWDWLSVLIICISIILVYFWTGVWTSVLSSSLEFYKAAAQMFGNLAYWCTTFVGVTVSLLPRFMYDSLQKIFYPKDIDVIRECWRRGDYDAFPEDYDPTDPNKVKISEYSRDQMKEIIGGSSQSSSTANSSHGNMKSQQDLEDNLHMNSSSTIQVDEFKDTIATESVIEAESQQFQQKPQRKLILNAFKRQSNAKSVYDSSSFIDTYNYSHAGTTEDLVATEEIALEEFDRNAKRASRISSDNKRYSIDRQRYSSEVRSPTLSPSAGHFETMPPIETSPISNRKIRTSLEFPELTTSSSLNK